MELLAALDKMEEVERKAALLYSIYKDHFRDDEEAAVFFHEMHCGENDHRNLIQYIRQLAEQRPDLFKEPDIEAAELDEISSLLDREIGRGRPPGLGAALQTSQELEICLREGYLRNRPLQGNDILLDLYDSLGDVTHAEMIAAFRNKKGV